MLLPQLLIQITDPTLSGTLMLATVPRRISQSSRAGRSSWLAPALALLAMMVPATGCQASAHLQILGLAGSSSDEGETEFPGEDEGGDSTDSDLEAHLLFRPSPRTFLPRLAGGMSPSFVVIGGSACFHDVLNHDRDAAACSAARLPLRC
jgi:hypothetical protein